MIDTLAQILHRPRVSYRSYGARGEYRRPIVHRFDIKGGATLAQAFADNLTHSNPLLERLKRGAK